MLQFSVKDVDVYRIKKILANHDIKSSITNQLITLEGNISDDIIDKLCKEIKILSVRNFASDVSIIPTEEIPFKTSNQDATSSIEEPKNKSATTDEHESTYPQTEKHEIEPTTTDEIDCSTTEEHEIESKATAKTETSAIKNEENQNGEILQTTANSTQTTKVYDLKYPNVKRGEVYLCDFGVPYGHEAGSEIPVLIIQSNIIDAFSQLTTVITFTQDISKIFPSELDFDFIPENFTDYIESDHLYKKEKIICAYPSSIDKSRLRNYIGSLKPEFMVKVDRKTHFALGFRKKAETVIITENEPIEKPTYVKGEVSEHQTVECKDLTEIENQLLSNVNINAILEIAKCNSSNNNKIQSILELFGFDFEKNGVKYLFEAIVISLKNNYFTLETLSDCISKIVNKDKDEIKRLIVARVKENFNFKKSPTIDFIRLVNKIIKSRGKI